MDEKFAAIHGRPGDLIDATICREFRINTAVIRIASLEIPKPELR
jgi:hypothetical protein